ncbi:GNAT family N-acetyltransferase [Methyloferula stellata]|uniref:GNAT family N-acetyltransferase n=1 Tax=Methyloferula stellata TaxID=876270 RepID=UPI000367E832|nr:N-acetyltransferase [Methyloferula stellata]
MTAKRKPAVPARRARLADVDALESLENKAFDGDRLSRRSLRYYVRAETVVMRVMKEDGALAAYSLLAFRKGSKIARLYSIAVDPAFEGYGLGRALLKACEKDARAAHCTTLRLEVRIDNKRAIALYEKNGFERYDEIEDYYEDGATAICLKKAFA